MLVSPMLIILGDFDIHAEATLLGMAQDFMFSMETMGLSQVVFGPSHAAGHALDRGLCGRKDDGDLGVQELSVVPLSRTDYYMVGFRQTGTHSSSS